MWLIGKLKNNSKNLIKSNEIDSIRLHLYFEKHHVFNPQSSALLLMDGIYYMQYQQKI